MLRDKMVFTVNGKLQELLLREDNLTLDKAVKICRAFEQSNRQVKEFRESATLPRSSTSVNKITQNSETKMPGGKKGSQMNKTSHKGREKLKFNCKFCGYKHEKQRDKCPAWGKTCDNCKGLNHFKSKCKNIHALNQSNDNEEDSDDQWLMAVSNGTDSVTATLTLNDIDVKFQLDTAADVNIICQRHVRQHQVSPTTVPLNMWNKTNLKPLEETRLKVKGPCSP